MHTGSLLLCATCWLGVAFATRCENARNDMTFIHDSLIATQLLHGIQGGMKVKVGDCVEVSHLGDDSTHLLQLKALWSEPTQTRPRMQALGQYFYRAEVAMISCSTLHYYYTTLLLRHTYLIGLV